MLAPVAFIGLATSFVFHRDLTPAEIARYGVGPRPYVARAADWLLPRLSLPGGRLALWQGVAPVLVQWPVLGDAGDSWRWLRPLAGYGPETQLLVTAHQYNPSLADTDGPYIVFDRMHNHYLDQVVTTGYLGLGLYLIATGGALWLAVRHARRGQYRALAAALAACLAAHMIEIFSGLLLTTSAVYGWLLVALVVALSRLDGAITGGIVLPDSTSWGDGHRCE